MTRTQQSRRRTAIYRELAEMAKRAGLPVPTVSFPGYLDRVHAKNRRRYAEVVPDTMDFRFAKATWDLDAAHRRGLLAHEVGHCIAHREIGPQHTEDEADACALQVLGVQMEYDAAWPGKGLQMAARTNPTYYESLAAHAEYGDAADLEDFGFTPAVEEYYGDAKYYGRNVIWVGTEGEMIKLTPVQLVPIEGNIFDFNKLATLRAAIENSDDRIELRSGYAAMSRVDPDSVRESIEYAEDNQDGELTTGDEDLDAWLVDPRGAVADGLYRTQAEAKAALKDAVRRKQGHLGMWIAQVRDGNHRAFAAVAAGERYVYLKVADNDLQDMRAALKGERSTFTRAEARELRDMLE